MYSFRNANPVLQHLNGMIRVVHGTEDVYSVIRRTVMYKPSNTRSKNDFQSSECHEHGPIGENEGEETLETNENGVWSLLIGDRLFENNFEAAEVVYTTLILFILMKM